MAQVASVSFGAELKVSMLPIVPFLQRAHTGLGRLQTRR